MTHLNNNQDTDETVIKDEKDNNNHNNHNNSMELSPSLTLPPSPTRKLAITGFPFLSNEQDIVENVKSGTNVTTTTTSISTYYTHRSSLLYRKSLIHLQRQVAAWYSRFTQELLLVRGCDDNYNPQEQLENACNRMMHRMDHCMDHCILSKDDSLKDHKDKDHLQRRMNRIENNIIQQSQRLSSLSTSFSPPHQNTWVMYLICDLQQLAQDVHTLQIQSNKRHEQMYAKLNHIASLVQTSLMETNAQRYATCTQLQQQLEQCTAMNHNKRQSFVLQIQQLKHDIQTMTQERMKRDEEIVHMIVQHRTMLEQVMMLCLDL